MIPAFSTNQWASKKLKVRLVQHILLTLQEKSLVSSRLADMNWICLLKKRFQLGLSRDLRMRIWRRRANCRPLSIIYYWLMTTTQLDTPNGFTLRLSRSSRLELKSPSTFSTWWSLTVSTTTACSPESSLKLSSKKVGLDGTERVMGSATEEMKFWGIAQNPLLKE